MHLPLLPLLLAPALALPTPPSPPYNATVLILGGGVAGVIAARTLARLAPSTSFLLLEARTELGGRLQSHRFPGYTLELGANWVHGTHTLGFDAVNPVWEMVERWGVQTVVSDYYGSITTYDHTGPVPYLSLLNDSLAAYATLVAHSPALAASSNLSSSARDGYSSLGYSPHTPHEHAAEYYTFDWEYADAPERTSWWASGSSTNNTYDPTTGGFSRTNHFSTDPRGFSHFLTQEAHEFLKPGQVVFNATVRSVGFQHEEEQGEEAGIEIELTTGTVLRAEYALCTFSLGVLQGGVGGGGSGGNAGDGAGRLGGEIRWSEEVMPPAKREAVRGMSMGVFTKIFLQFEEKFWFDTEFALYADPHTHGRYPVWQSLDHAKFSPGSGVLFVTVTGDFAKRVDAMPEEEVKAEVLEVLGRMYPGVEIPEPTSFHIPHWLSDPLFRGSYSNWPAGFTRAQHAVVRAKTGGRVGGRGEKEGKGRGKGRVWFAGEHTSERWFGFLHGAYYEGVAAAEEIVECLRGGAGCAEVMDFEAL